MSAIELVKRVMNEVMPSKDFEGITDIVEGGYITSFELMQLIAALEKECNLQIGFEDITPENFNSLEAIAEMVNRKK